MITFAKLGNLGRLGNMLFEAAATIALALRNNDTYVFPDCYLKNISNIPEDKFSNKINYNFTYEEPYFHYCPISYRPNMNLNGYFQSELYFKDFENEIKELFRPKNINILKGYTSIHVRRTDYLVHNDCYIILNCHNYYNKAIEEIKSDKYLIFSDDIGWCKENFKGNNFEFSEGNSDYDDFCLMMSCENNIIANSSFSWWASWLNSNKNKKIIAPASWFGPKLYSHNTKDLYPKEWIKI